MLFNIAAVAGIRWLSAAAHTGSGSLTLWLLAAVLFFVPSALAIAALSERHPEQGGIYMWTSKAFGDWHGFLCGWCYWLSNLFYLPNLLVAGVGMTAYALGFGEHQGAILSVSLGILWVSLMAQIAGASFGKWVSNVGAAATYSAGLLLIGLGLWVWSTSGSATPLDLAPRWDLDKLNFWSQIAFAFGGLELSAVMSAEIHNPRRTVPLAAWISGFGITAFYILGTLALLVLLAPDSISILTGLVQAGDAAGLRLGMPWISVVLGGLVIAGVAGQFGAWLGGSARILFAIGIDSALPPVLTRAHPRWGTPHIAILMQGVVCTAFVLALQYGENLRIAYQLLVDMTVITYLIPFLYMFAASGKYGNRWSSLSGLLVTVLAIVLSLVPPADAQSVWWFEAKLVGGCAALILAARLCYRGPSRR